MLDSRTSDIVLKPAFTGMVFLLPTAALIGNHFVCQLPQAFSLFSDGSFYGLERRCSHSVALVLPLPTSSVFWMKKIVDLFTP
jgi:hypothetical protein